MLIPLLIAGCSSASLPKTQHVATTQDRELRIGHELRDWAALTKAHKTDGGLIIDTDDATTHNGYTVIDLFTLNDIPDTTAGQAYHRLHTALTAHGWRIITYGPADDDAHTPEITAETAGRDYHVRIDWDHHIDKDSEAQLRFTIESRYFTAPSAHELS